MTRNIFPLLHSKAARPFVLETDMHNHIVPGIDDGSGNIEESLSMIESLQQAGVKKIICTPHIIRGLYPNTPETIFPAFKLLQDAVQQRWPNSNLQLEVAAEYMIDEFFLQHLEQHDPLLMNKQYMLIEFPLQGAAPNYKEAIFEIRLNDYFPILAHPERYVYAAHNNFFFEELKDWGCLFQLNLFSVLGGYGKEVRRLADKLLKKEMYDLVGTDIHKRQHGADLCSPATMALLGKAIGSYPFRNTAIL